MAPDIPRPRHPCEMSKGGEALALDLTSFGRIRPVGSRVNSTPVLHGAYDFFTFRPDDEHCLLPLLLESHSSFCSSSY